jgi:hypothetical protein
MTGRKVADLEGGKMGEALVCDEFIRRAGSEMDPVRGRRCSAQRPAAQDLGWKTPAEALNEHLLLTEQGGVATTD